MIREARKLHPDFSEDTVESVVNRRRSQGSIILNYLTDVARGRNERSAREVVDVGDWDRGRSTYDSPYFTVNDYLSAGWTLVDKYVVNHGDGPGVRDEEMRYVLGWLKDDQPVHPNKEDAGIPEWK